MPIQLNMIPVSPCSTSNFFLIPGTAFTIEKRDCLTRCGLSRKSAKHELSSRRLAFPPASVRLFSQYRRDRAWLHGSALQQVLATGTDVALEESGVPTSDEDSSKASEIPTDAVEKSGPSSKADSSPAATQSKRLRTGRRSEMPPVKNEDLVAGAAFTGKVRSIQPFGAFVDFGAFTDGLVHVSRLSDSFVKDVGSFVSVGQEVKVRLVEANMETGRISLSMRASDDPSKLQQQKDDRATSSSDKPRPARRNTSKTGKKKEEFKSSKFVKGQELKGTVKNMTRAGAFISLPEGEEGFLPTSEESDDGFANIMGGSSLQVGQEVSVRVLRITRGQVTLTMKKEEDNEKLDFELSQGAVHVATNPFALAFRQNKEIAAFLDQREKLPNATKVAEEQSISAEVEGKVNQTEIVSDVPTVQDQLTSSEEQVKNVPSRLDETAEEDETSTKNVAEEANIATDDKGLESIQSTPRADGEVEAASEEVESSNILDSEESAAGVDQIVGEAPQIDGVKIVGELDSSEEIVSQAISSDTPDSEEGAKSQYSIATDNAENEISSEAAVKDEGLGATADENGSITVSDDHRLDVPTVQDQPTSSEEQVKNVSSTLDETAEENETSSKNEAEGTNIATDDKGPESIESTANADGEVQAATEEVESSNVLDPEESAPGVDQTVGEAPQTEGVKNVAELDLSEEIASHAISSDAPASEEGAKNQYSIAADDNTVNAENEISSEAAIKDKGLGATADENGSIAVSDEQPDVASHQQAKDGVESLGKSDSPGDTSNPLTSEGQNDAELENRVENTEGEVQTEAPAAENEFSRVVNEDDKKVEPASEKNDSNSNPNGHSASPSPKQNGIKATISPALVKQLREETGAGMMDCKKALSETGGDIVKAQEFLRKKGLASAEKKASRATAEGRIGSYIHDSRIGVLIEVNCETDFVSRGDIFKDLVDDLAMQVAACPQVQYLVAEDVPAEIVNKEREIEMQKEDLLSKPEQIRSRIVEGRIKKRLEELALLDQPYIKNDKVVVKDWVKQTIATIGENIKVKRFVRYNLGEGLEKKSQDFAAEVAAQTATKPAAAPANEQPVKAEVKEIAQKPPAATISAALVKQLREETGAGMMDCKKALSETGGDLEKAQEYLRKKGLSTADKKSSRLAAEGRIGSYIHDSRIGVLIEVNCETDFVGRSEKFKELVDDLAMQVVACPQVQFVSVEYIPESIVNKEKELEMQREDLLSKPENIREKIVEGRISKRLGELALLEQPFIKNDTILVKELVKQTVAALGENIKVRRFVRFTLGETTDDAKKEAEA